MRLNRLPGWEKNSWGYHGDDGNSFASEKEGTSFGPRFTSKLSFAYNGLISNVRNLAGDVIGCGIDFSLHKAFYTKNSSFIGELLSAFTYQRCLMSSKAIYLTTLVKTTQ